tara:strand:+ start:1240 stop:1371 length:132 start_codon:yes stop_codon:yes gene_type:complete
MRSDFKNELLSYEFRFETRIDVRLYSTKGWRASMNGVFIVLAC